MTASALDVCPSGHEIDEEGLCDCYCTLPLPDDEDDAWHPADDPHHLTSDRF